MFTQQYIVSVNPPVLAQGSFLISWVGVNPPGYVYQVYLNRSLAKSTTQPRVHIPPPADTVRLTIGSVPVSEATTSFGATLPLQPETRARLSWQGGAFEEPLGTVLGFRVYGEPTPGAGIDYGTPLDDQPVFVAGIRTDGFGMGGFGSGGFGMVAGNYQWTSDRLPSGTWHWAIVPYDAAGNEGTPTLVSTAIVSPPLEPAADPNSATRLHYRLLGAGQSGFGAGGFGEPIIQLYWNPSPG